MSTYCVYIHPPLFDLPPLFRRALDREYEINMLANGDFDERMFLHPNASEEIGTPSRFNTTLSARLMMTQVLYTPGLPATTPTDFVDESVCVSVELFHIPKHF